MSVYLQHRWTSHYLLLLSLGSFLLFLYGFCPLKYVTGRLASWDDLPNDISNVSMREVYNSTGARVIFMIIDSWRLDYLSEKLMPFTAGLVKNKSACSYVALAEPPTATMPRIKAMMTGTGSTFADVVLNFGAWEVKGDSVVRSAHRHGKRNVLYGDNTWASLFPGLWAESDPVEWILLKDFYEVDNNVSRHLGKILQGDEHRQPPFDFLTLHFIGLDHIGHVETLRSPKIALKLKEMDGVVKKIFRAMTTWSVESALIVCGDHGMLECGGHGGGTLAESQVPLVLARTGDFVCPHECQPGPKIAQTAVAPSIAYLLRVPIPADSIGQALPAVFPSDPKQHLYLLHYNALENSRAVIRMLGKEIANAKECYKKFCLAEQQFALYLSTQQTHDAHVAKRYYEESLVGMAMLLNIPAVAFDMFVIGLAIMMLSLVLIALGVVTVHSLQRRERTDLAKINRSTARTFVMLFLVFSATLSLTCMVTKTSSNVCHLSANWTPIAAAIVIAITYGFLVVQSGIRVIMEKPILPELSCVDCLLIAGSLVQSVTFIGTSYLDEEQLTWYHYWNTLMLLSLLLMPRAFTRYNRLMESNIEDQDRLKNADSRLALPGTIIYSKILSYWLLVMALNRLFRTLNQHWVLVPDWTMKSEYAGYLQALVVIGMAATFQICLWNLQYTNNVYQTNTAFTIGITACIICYRIATHSLTALNLSMTSWDPVNIVNVFWGLLAAQFVFESITLLGFNRQNFAGSYGVRSAISDEYWNNDDYIFVHENRHENCEVIVKVKESASAHTTDDMFMKFTRSFLHMLLSSLMLTAALLMRPHNVILVPGLYATCVLTTKCMRYGLLSVSGRTQHRSLNLISQTLIHFWIGQVFFFYQGNSNTLATVDLVSGYVGLREYSPGPIALRIAFHTYAAPILAALMLLCKLSHQRTWTQYKRAVWVAMNVLALQRVYALAVYACVATWHKEHSMIFSSFSPKLLYDLLATVCCQVLFLTVASIYGVTHLMHWVARLLPKEQR